MKLPKFTVKRGIIHVNLIDVMHCSDDVLIFVVDCAQKRPSYQGETFSGEADTEGFCFELGTDEETLHVENQNDPLTEIQVDWGGKGNYWTLVEENKWGIRVVIAKVKRIAQFIDDDNFTDGSI